MQIANRTFSTDMVTQSPPGSPPVAAVKPQKVHPVPTPVTNQITNILYKLYGSLVIYR